MSNTEPWLPCPSGELEQLQENLKFRRQLQRTRRNFLISGGTITAGIIATIFLLAQKEKSPILLNCPEAIELMPGYHNGTLGPRQRKAVKDHLAHCAPCRAHYQKVFHSPFS